MERVKYLCANDTDTQKGHPERDEGEALESFSIARKLLNKVFYSRTGGCAMYHAKSMS
jgi:hypothetical protein